MTNLIERSVSLLLALVMLLSLPAAALEETALAQEQSANTQSESAGTEEPATEPESAEPTEQGGQQQPAQPEQQTPASVPAGEGMEAEPEILAQAEQAEQAAPVYFSEEGAYLAPEELTVYRVMTMEQTLPPEETAPQPAQEHLQEKYTGVVAFYDYAQQDEQTRYEQPYFFYYQDGLLQSGEVRMIPAQGYLDLRSAPVAEAEINAEAEQGERLVYVGREVYVDAEAQEHPDYLFAFNQPQQANGLFTGSFEEQAYEAGLTKPQEQTEEQVQEQALAQQEDPLRTDAPLNAVAANAEKGVELRWPVVANAVGYRIFRAEGSAAPTTEQKLIDVAKMDDPVYVDEGVENGKSYTYSIRAYKGAADAMDGDTAYTGSGSKWDGAKTVSIVRLAGTNLSVKANQDQFVLSWTAVAGADSYVVRRSVNGGEFTDIYTGSALTYTDADVQHGVRYYYTAAAMKDTSVGYAPDEHTDLNRSVILPSTMKLSALNGVGGVELNWTAEVGATGYQVSRQAVGEQGMTVLANLTDAAALTFTDRSAANGVRYTYEVRGCYGNAAEMSARPLTDRIYWGEARQAAVIRLGFDNIYSHTKGLVLTWKAVSGVSGYEITYRTSPSVKWAKAVDVGGRTSYVLTGVKNGTTYYTAIRTYVTGGNGKKTYSRWSIHTTPEVYHAPLTVTAGMGANGVKVAWRTDPLATGYRVFRIGGGKMAVVANVKPVSKATAYVVDSAAGLTSGTTYKYTVRPYYGHGDVNTAQVANSPEWGCYLWVGIIYVKTPVLKAAVNYYTGTRVDWEASAGATGYTVYRKAGAKGKWVKVGTVTKGTVTRFVDTGVTKVKSGTMLYYTVRATNRAKALTGYDPAGKGVYYLSIPANLNLKTPTATGTMFTWGAVPGAQSYRVYRRLGAKGKWKLLSVVSGTAFVDKKVTNTKQEYYYTVRAAATVNGESWLSSFHKTGVSFRIRWKGKERGQWVKQKNNFYYVDKDGLLLTGWNYVKRNGKVNKYYFDEKTGVLSTNLYHTFGRKMRDMQTYMELYLCNNDDYASHVNIWLYDNETKRYCIPAVTFRCIGSTSITIDRSSHRSCWINANSGDTDWLVTSPVCYERYAVRLKGSNGYFHSVLFRRPDTFAMQTSTYNSLSYNNNNSNGCIRCQCIFLYLMQDIMKNGYGRTHAVSVDVYNGKKELGPFGIPQIETVSRSQDYEPTDPAYTGKFFYPTQIQEGNKYIKAKAGAPTWTYF